MRLPDIFDRPILFRTIFLVLAAGIIFAFPGSSLAQEDEEEFSQVTAEAQDDVRKAVDAFNAGQEAHAAGDLDKASALYEEAIRLMPEFPEAEFQLATILDVRGDREKAEAGYRRAISYRSDWTLPMSALGGLLVSTGRYEEGRSILESTLQIDGLCIPCYPPLTEAYLRTAVSPDLLKTHLQKLTILTSKTKIPASIWAAKAAVERARGDIAAAKESVRRGLLVDEDSDSVQSELVEIRLVEGDFDGAVSAARRVSEANPGSIQAKLRLARAEHAAGNTETAIKIVEAIPSGNSQAAGLLAAFRSRSAEDPEVLKKELEAAPDNAAILGRLCALTRLSDPGSSLDYCFRASQAEPSNISHAIGYGAALLQLKRYEQAAAILGRLKATAPDNYTVRANLATALFQMGRFEDARLEYQWITEKEPEVPAAHYFLAISLDRLERYTEALASYQSFLKLADKEEFADEIGRVELRLPVLQRQIKEGKGRN